MEKFFKATAWTMETPKAWGPWHLSFLLVGLAVSILLAFFLRKSNEKANKIILLICGGFLVLSEIYKQLFYVFVLGGGHYVWWIFPFQLCSIPMYLLFIVPFIKNKMLQNSLYNFIFAFNLFGGFISYLEPSGLLHPYVTLTIHALLWHMVLVFVGLYLFASGRAGQKLKGFLGALSVFGICAVVAELFNIIFRTKPGFNMLYISPYYNSPIVFFKDINLKYGWLANAALYLFALALGAFIFYVSFWGIKKLIIYLKNKKNKVKDSTLEVDVPKK